MNEAMRQAWLEISQMLGEPTREELDMFLRTWQRAIQAEREECAKECDELAGVLACHGDKDGSDICVSLRDTIRARGNT